MYAPFGNKKEIQNNICHACGKTRPERIFRVLGGSIDTAEELVKAHEQRRNDKNGSIYIYTAVLTEVLCAYEKRRNYLHSGYQAGGGNEQQSLICSVNLFIETASVSGVVFHYRRHIPCLKEDRRYHGNKIGNFGRISVNSRRIFTQRYPVACHIADEKTVGKSGDDPHNYRRNKRNGKFHHTGSKPFVVIAYVEMNVQLCYNEQEYRRAEIGENNGKHEAFDSPVQVGDEYYIEDEKRKRCQDAVQREELDHSLCPDKLGTQRPECRSANVYQKKYGVAVYKVEEAYELQQRSKDKHQQQSGAVEYAGSGKYLSFVVFVVKSISDDRFCH